MTRAGGLSRAHMPTVSYNACRGGGAGPAESRLERKGVAREEDWTRCPAVFTAFPALPGPSICGAEPVWRVAGLSPAPLLSWGRGVRRPGGGPGRTGWGGQWPLKRVLGEWPGGHSRRAGASGVRRRAPCQFLTAGPLSPDLPASRRLSAAPSGPPGDARPSLQRGRPRPAG